MCRVAEWPVEKALLAIAETVVPDHSPAFQETELLHAGRAKRSMAGARLYPFVPGRHSGTGSWSRPRTRAGDAGDAGEAVGRTGHYLREWALGLSPGWHIISGSRTR